MQPNDVNLLGLIAFGNLLLVGMNLLPAFPMDGGRILRALLSYIRPEDEATRIAAWMGRMLAISMGLYGLLASQFMLVFFALFVYLGAAMEFAAALGRSLTHGIPVRAAMMTEFHTLEHGKTIRDAANMLLATSQQDFPIMHGDQVVGLLGRNLLLKALAAEGPDAYVAGVMDRDFLSIEPGNDLAEVLPLMAQAGRCALVMDGEKLVGLLTTENLSEFLRRPSIPICITQPSAANPRCRWSMRAGSRTPTFQPCSSAVQPSSRRAALPPQPPPPPRRSITFTIGCWGRRRMIGSAWRFHPMAATEYRRE
jgi:CBS domain-containing protein